MAINFIDIVRWAVDRTQLEEALILVSDVPGAVTNLVINEETNEVTWDIYSIAGVKTSYSHTLEGGGATEEEITEIKEKIAALENAEPSGGGTPYDDTRLSQRIDNEATARTNADTVLDNKITTNTEKNTQQDGKISALENAEPSGGGTPYDDSALTRRVVSLEGFDHLFGTRLTEAQNQIETLQRDDRLFNVELVEAQNQIEVLETRAAGLEEKTSPISHLPSTPVNTDDNVRIALARENDIVLTDEAFSRIVAPSGGRQTGKLVAKFGTDLSPSDYVFTTVNAEGAESILVYGSDLLKLEQAQTDSLSLIKSYGSGDTNILVNIDANVYVKVQKLDHNSKANFLLDTKPKEQVTALIQSKINEIPAPVIPPSSSGSGLSGNDRIKLDQHQLIFVPKPTPFETRGFKQDATDTNVVGNYTQADSFTAVADGKIQFIIDSNEARTHADFTISDGINNVSHTAVESFTINGVTYFVYQFTGVTGKTYTASFNGGSRHLKSNLDIEKNRADILSLKNEQRESTSQVAKDFHKAIVESTAVIDDKIEDKRVDSVKCFATLDDVDSVKLAVTNLTLTAREVDSINNFNGFSVSAGIGSNYVKGGSLTPSFPSSLLVLYRDNNRLLVRTKAGEETSVSVIIDGTRYDIPKYQTNRNGFYSWGGFNYDLWRIDAGSFRFTNRQAYDIQLIFSGVTYKIGEDRLVKQFARANIYGANVLEKGSTATLKTAISETEVDQQGFANIPLEVEGVSSNSLVIAFLMKMRASSGQDVSLIKKSGRDILVLKGDAIYARNYQPAKVANSPSEEHTDLRFDNNTRYTYTVPQFDVGVTDIHVALPADLVGNPNAVVSNIVLNIHRSETADGLVVNADNEVLSIPLNADLSPTVAIPEFVEGNYGSEATRVLFSHKSSATGKDIAIQVQLPFNSNRVAIDSLKVTASLDYQVVRTEAVAESTIDIPLISTEDLIVDVRLTTNQETSLACELYEDENNGLQIRTVINNTPSYVRFANWTRSKIVGTTVVIAKESRVLVSILTILSFKAGTKRVFETESLPKKIEVYGLGLLAFFKSVGEEFDIGKIVLKSQALTAHIGDEHNAIGSVSNTTFNLGLAADRNSTPKPILFTGEIESLPEGWAYDHDTGLTTLPKGLYMVCITVGGHYTGLPPSYKNEVYSQIILGDSDGHEIHTAQFIPRTISEKQSLAGVFVSDGIVKLLISVKIQTISFTANVVFDKGHLHIIRIGNVE